MWRRQDPRHTRIGEKHIALPPGHRNNRKLKWLIRSNHFFTYQHFCQFSGCQAVKIRHGVLADKRAAVGIGHRPFHLVPSERIRTVENHKLLSKPRTLLHSQPHGGYKRVGTASVILYVINQHIDILKHFGCRTPCRTIKRMHLDPRHGILCNSDFLPRRDIPSHPMLRGEERDKVDTGGFMQDVDS